MVLAKMWLDMLDFAPAYIHEAIAGCRQDAEQRPDLQHTIDKMGEVPDFCRKYMYWPSEARLRKAGWYSFHVARREADISFHPWFENHLHCIKFNFECGEELVLDSEWLP